MKLKTLIALGACAAVALVAVGCGGDDDEGDAPDGADTLSQEEYLAQGNEICAEARDEVGRLTQEATEAAEGELSEEEAGELLNAVGPVLKGALARLRELPPPEEDADTVNAIIDDADAYVDSVGETGMPDPSVADPIDQRFTDYGLTVCDTRTWNG